MTKKKTANVTASALPQTLNPRALADIIDDALRLLADHNPGPLVTTSDLPLPSLLDRCEALLLDTKVSAAPLRLLHSFAAVHADACAALLSGLPNLALMSADAFQSRPIADLPDAMIADASEAAILSVHHSLTHKGVQLVVRVDQLARSTRPKPTKPPFEGQQMRAALLVEHPLLSYLAALPRGELTFRPATLEAYSERYLAYLAKHPDLPQISVEEVTTQPAAALCRLSLALDMPVPAGHLAIVETEGHDAQQVQPDPVAVPLRTGDGSPMTDESLESPAYLRLCNALGYAPDVLPPEQPFVTRPVTEAPKRQLPPRRKDRAPSRIAAFLPHFVRVADHHDVSKGTADSSEIIAMVEDCLGHPNGFFETLDRYLSHLPPSQSALVLLGCAAHHSARQETIIALSLIAEAEDYIALQDRPLRLFAAELLLGLNQPNLALVLLTADAFGGPFGLPNAQQTTLRNAIRQNAPAPSEHGHALLLSALDLPPPSPIERPRLMIEIGTTRERVAGQGSTEKLAVLCAKLGIDFITVDMDPRNCVRARRMFQKRNLPFRAVTAKGEDFLAQWPGLIDYCFLDAYDFDHGNHSELRQSRYETFLGSRIADAQCHQMHLDCAVSLVEKLSPDGIICFDDTWKDDHGAWTAKGTTAMPYLLAHGFKVTEAANRAALLVRT